MNLYKNLPPDVRAELERNDARANTPEGRYGLGKRIEYRVKEVTRYVVTRWEADVQPPGCGSSGSSAVVAAGGAQYDNWETAYAVAYALCKADHDWLGYPLGDDRVMYPVSVPPGTEMSLDPNFHSEDEIREVGSVFANKEGDLESRS